MKAERNLNEGQFILRINRRLRNLDDVAKIYFKMHLLMAVEVEKIDWQQVLGYAAGSSVIDYYLDYCKICSYIICDSETTKERKDYVRKLLEELKRDIQEPLLEKIAFNGDYFELSEIEHSIQKIGAHYTEGRYQDVIDECREWLQRRANIFEIYVYYIKACIISGNVSEFSSHKEDVSYLDSDSNRCIRDALLDILYAVYQKRPGCERAFDEIRVLMRYLNGFFIAPELYDFYLKKVAYYFSDFWRKSLEYQAQYHNTRSCFLYENELRQKYLDVFKENCG